MPRATSRRARASPRRPPRTGRPRSTRGTTPAGPVPVLLGRERGQILQRRAQRPTRVQAGEHAMLRLGERQPPHAEVLPVDGEPGRLWRRGAHAALVAPGLVPGVDRVPEGEESQRAGGPQTRAGPCLGRYAQELVRRHRGVARRVEDLLDRALQACQLDGEGRRTWSAIAFAAQVGLQPRPQLVQVGVVGGMRAEVAQEGASGLRGAQVRGEGGEVVLEDVHEPLEVHARVDAGPLRCGELLRGQEHVLHRLDGRIACGGGHALGVRDDVEEPALEPVESQRGAIGHALTRRSRPGSGGPA